MTWKNEDELSMTAGNWHPAEGEEGVVIGTFYNLRQDDVTYPHF